MKHLLPSRTAIWFFGFTLAAALSAQAASLPAGWQRQQPFIVSAAGLLKVSLPVETLDAARPGLEDLRIYDDAGHELPYLIEHPASSPPIIGDAKSFQTSLNSQNTVVTIETGFTEPLNGLTLETPANNFIKSVLLEGSADGQGWQIIARGIPIFRQASGASQLYLEIPPKVWPWLRLTVDDQRSQPIPFTGARLQAASGASAPEEPLAVTISDRHESPGETRLSLNLGAANLTVSDIQIDTDEPLFTRPVTLAESLITENSIHEEILGQGVIYRLTIEGRPATANLSLPLEKQVRSRELLLRIHNQDSPPLIIKSIHATRRPVYAVFLTKQTGAHYLLSGNAHCAAPRYDLAALSANLKAVAVAPVPFSPLAENPEYHTPEALPNVPVKGTTLDISAWRFRKPIKLTHPGAQQLELDLDILSQAQRGFEDARLMRAGQQIPYILERTSISREITPSLKTTNNPKDPKTSRWVIKLPRAGLPVELLTCECGTAVFQRDVFLYEELSDERGEKYRRILNQATWAQTPDRVSQKFVLPFATPQGDTLLLETQNGDNPPIQLAKLTLYYPVTRALFKADSTDDLFLYYGNPGASAPQYDLSLVANELLAAAKTTANLGPEESLRKSTWRATGTPGDGGLLFWGILGLVVVVLLVVISRLLPKSDS